MRTLSSLFQSHWTRRHTLMLGLALALVALHVAAPGLVDAQLLPLSVIGFAGITVDIDDIATTRSDPGEVQKKVYLMARDLVPESNVLTAQFRKTRKFSGTPVEGFRFNTKLEVGGAVSNVKDGGVMPRASRGQRKTGKVVCAHTYSTLNIGGQAIAQTTQGRNSFVSEKEEQFDDAMRRVELDIERQYNGDGRGILGVVTSVSGAPTYGISKPYGATNAGNGCMLLIEDMDVAFINPANGAERGRATIDGTDPDAETFETSATVAAVAIGDYVVLCNDVGASGTEKENNYANGEANGILAWMGSNTFEDIPGTFKRWQAPVLSNNGTLRPISERLVATLEARIHARSKKKPNLHYTSYGIRLEMQDQLAAMRRFSGETRTLRGGYEALVMNGRDVVVGDMVAKGRWFALNTEDGVVGWLDLVKAGFIDLDGAQLSRIPGRHAYTANYWFPHNAAVFERACHGVISDLQDDFTISR